MKPVNLGLGLGALALFLSASPVAAQDALTLLNTGAGQPLVSEARPLFVDGALVEPRLLFDFGFATDEAVALGAFLDSFTITIQDSNQVFTALYLTADAAGTVLAPPTPGTVVVDPASISLAPLPYPNLVPVFAFQRAFAVSAPIPAQFSASPITVYFDLFDNLDAIASQGWFSDLRIVAVPEPQTWTLLLLAGAATWWGRRCKR